MREKEGFSLWETARIIRPCKLKTYLKTNSQMQSLQTKIPISYKNLIKTLELSKSLYLQYVTANPGEKAKMLKLVASNYTLSDVSICPTYRKPFDKIAKGLSRPNWLPIVDEFRNFLMSEEADIVLEHIKDFWHNNL